MNPFNRRQFLQRSAILSAGAAVITKNATSANDTIHMAVTGLRSRGQAHYRQFCSIPNVKVVAVCDIDERLFPEAIEDIEKLSGTKPKTYVDFREMMEDQDIEAVSVAVPDHWHALMTIWACQAGKDVYVEKPLSYTIEEGRKMVQAARKYNRVVQVGTQHVRDRVVQEGLKRLWDGEIGELYMGRVIVFGRRGNIGHVPDSQPPEGVNWNLFLGPAPYRPFNQNRFHYKWHWFWETSTTEFGNNGVHYMGLVRRAFKKREHPIGIHCTGGYYVFESDQEIPNIQTATFEYGDGILTEMKVRSLHTNPEAGEKGGAVLYGSKGWMYLSPGNFRLYEGDDDTPKVNMTGGDAPPLPEHLRGDFNPHFKNFIDCVRSRRWQDLHADVLEGHLSTTICHLGNISYRTGRKLTFNPHAEKFVNDDDANNYLPRIYREPFSVPEEV